MKNTPSSTTATNEIRSGDRFAFGENWASYSKKIDEARVQSATSAMHRLFGHRQLAGKRFLDAGSGSGLMSLAARRLGMSVVSFDFDPASVTCTSQLKSAYFPGDDKWTVCEGSVLDRTFVAGLGSFDIVYSWGVLHHTGDMWSALENAMSAVSSTGSIAVALYNDQGVWSKVWRLVKYSYNKLPNQLRVPFVVLVMAPIELKSIAVPLLKGKLKFVLGRWFAPEQETRGMDRWHDMIDWVGGYPFEVSKPEDVFHFFRDRGFSLVELKTCAGELGCNEYVFERQTR
jgi:2-polyprenyl-6-hydroxyphenyl methylase/3-demethylubiquinone-9 3-methyltransferase